MVESTMVEIGDVIDGRYEVVRVLEDGDFGCICDARHARLGQRFTLKLVYREHDEHSTAVRRLQKEAQATSLVQHENAVFITDVGQCPEHGHYMVMEHRAGERLSSLLGREKTLALGDAIRITMDAASAVASAHDYGVIHRDLTPENLFVERSSSGDCICKVTGFGIEGTVIDEAAAPGAANPEFRAPELRLGATPNASTDQFALCAVAYRMLTGEAPSSADVDNDDLTAPSDFNEQIPPALDDAVLRGLRRASSGRFDHVEAFVDAMVQPGSGQLTPRSDPLDGPGLGRTSDAMTSAGMGLVSTSEPASLVIDFDELEASDKRRLTLTFQTHERLRREYRRNIVAGGVFVPTDQSFELQEVVDLEIGLVDDDSVCVEAEVVSVQPPGNTNGGGVGLSLTSQAVEALGVFMRKQAGLDLQPSDGLRLSDEDVPDGLGRAAAYLVSRLTTPRTLAELRRDVSGLPLDLSAELSRLVERGLVEVDPDLTSELSAADDAATATEVPTEAMTEEGLGVGAIVDLDSPWDEPLSDGLDEPSRMDYTAGEVERVMSLVDYQVRRQNYMAAIRTLQKAIVVSPSVARFHHRLAKLHMQFSGDESKALRSIEDALKIDPDNDAMLRTLRQIERALS